MYFLQEFNDGKESVLNLFKYLHGYSRLFYHYWSGTDTNKTVENTQRKQYGSIQKFIPCIYITFF
jgi:hypothetical protein